ncbi:tetratricopeptide repeat protein [Sphingobium sp. TB-6]|uniref:tetratricopeptide repeat protein n=1 Tax=Sphingobium sp. TB-6 TaxID=2728850 RepID=UPI00076FFA9E|nr:tetratricopeptide repeat protein [Sphingobium sp. TB-6]AMK22830.1 TPR repeat protein [Sphingobium sp. TKS]NML89030.1 tetratricopeptide repeat protein [Sphingobium sp. TB-6]
MSGGKRVWMMRGALLLCLAAPLHAQAPYVPDITEAREKEWRKLVAASQAAYALGKPADGIDPARKGLALADELFGADDPRTLISANDLALQLDSTGHYREAESLYRRVFDSYLRTRGEDDPNTQLAVENLVDFYVARKRYDAAGPLADYALRSFRRTTGSGSTRSQRMEQIVAAISQPVAAPSASAESAATKGATMDSADPAATPVPELAPHVDNVEKTPATAMESIDEKRP